MKPGRVNRTLFGRLDALEALRRYRQGRGFDVGQLLHYARVCQVENVMRPYIEALL